MSKKFKKGDKVTVKEAHYHWLDTPTGTITDGPHQVNGEDCYEVQASDRNCTQSIYHRDLALIPEKKTKALSPQAKRVLEYLLTGKDLTRLKAMFDLGVANVTALIADLRNAGIDVKCRMKMDHNNREYGEWFLVYSERMRVKHMQVC